MDEESRLAGMIAAAIQCAVSLDKEKNLADMLDWIDQAAALHADLVVLPELWNTPFDNTEILNHQDDFQSLLPALQNKARILSIWIIAGTLPVFEDGKLYNQCFVISSQGEIVQKARKLHLLEVHTKKNTYREADVFAPGNELVSFDSPWGQIGILICYDIRFPEAARLLGEKCFLLACPCGFNEQAGKKHWQALVEARAIENEVFVIAANPSRQEWKSYTGYGHSMIVSPDGISLARIGSEPGICLAEIEPEKVSEIRRRSPYWKQRRLDLYSLEQTDKSGRSKCEHQDD